MKGTLTPSTIEHLSMILHSPYGDQAVKILESSYPFILRQFWEFNWVQQVKQNSKATFIDYLKSLNYSDFPQNCFHIKISYVIYHMQGNSPDQDPTAFCKKLKLQKQVGQIQENGSMKEG